MGDMLTDKDSKTAFLLRYGQMRERVEYLVERRKAYETDVYGIKSPVLSDMPKGSRKNSGLDDKVVKLLSQTEDIDNELESLRVKMEYIKTVIHRLKNYRLLSVLEMFYIDGLQRKQIGAIMGVQTQMVDITKRRAIEVLPMGKEDLEKII